MTSVSTTVSFVTLLVLGAGFAEVNASSNHRLERTGGARRSAATFGGKMETRLSLASAIHRGDGILKEVKMSSSTWRMLSNFCFVAGFVSVVVSIAIWFLFREPDAAHGERFGIFVGLWAPTFFALSSRLDQQASKVPGS